MSGTIDSILDIERKIESLRERDTAAYSAFHRIYELDSGMGEQVIPDSFRTKVREYFGWRDGAGKITESNEEVVARIEHQRIIKITNKYTGESALFNSLRAIRPGIRGMDLEKEKNLIFNLVTGSEEGCDFCQPEKFTPLDVFGRVRGDYSITAANLAKYDVWSSLVIFQRHDPLQFTREEFYDYLDTGFAWFEAVESHSPEFRFPFFIWNCLPRAGASQVHGHCQILMSKEPYAGVENLRKAYHKYEGETGTSYFKDLNRVYSSLGLSLNQGDVPLMVSITPIKEKEVMIISRKSPSRDNVTKETIFKVLRCFIDILGVFSFNLSISCPPTDDQEEFPYIIRIVDRGSLLKSTADIGGMELYGSSVVADDPFKIVKALRNVL